MKPADISMLVVDDEQLILETISTLFTSYGFYVDCASSGNIAWEMVCKNKYNVVFSDIRMPDGDGLELVRRIKSTYGNQIGVLFMSGFSDLQNEEIYHIGAEGKFSKPFNTKAARSAIEQSLMAPYARWSSSTFIADPKSVVIEKKGEDIKSLKAQKAVDFGRGGFFIAHNYAPPPKGSMIKFSIYIANPTPVLFQGHGVVRWIQAAGRSTAPPGLGVEIIQMDPSAAKTYTELFGSENAFIPSFAYAAMKD